MAGHSESVSSEKKSSNELNELLTLNAENMQSNMKIIFYRFHLTKHGFNTMLNTFIWLGTLYSGWTKLSPFISLPAYGTVGPSFGVLVLVWMTLYFFICMKQSPECMAT